MTELAAIDIIIVRKHYSHTVCSVMIWHAYEQEMRESKSRQ